MKPAARPSEASPVAGNDVDLALFLQPPRSLQSLSQTSPMVSSPTALVSAKTPRPVPTSRAIEIPDPPQHEKAIAMLAQRLSRLESQFLQFQTSNVSLHPPELPTRTDHSTSAVQIAAMDVRMSKLETLLGQVSQRLQTLEETRVQAVWTEITRFENASHEYLNGMRVDVDARLKSMDEHVLRCHAAVQRFEETMGQLMVRQYEFERAVRQSLTQFEYSSMAQQEKRASGSMGSPGAGRP